MAKYKVLVSFETIIEEKIHSSHLTRLGKNPKIHNIKKLSQEKNNVYVAEIEVIADNWRIAELKSLQHIRDLISLLAIKGDAFRIIISRTKIKNLDLGQQEHTVDWINHFFGIKDGIVRNNFEFENKALSWNDKWSYGLREALRYNFLAVLSQDFHISLVLKYSCLELISAMLFNNQKCLLKTKFKNEQSKKKKFLDEVKMTCKKYGFTNDEASRIMNQIQSVHLINTKRRLKKVLEKLNIDASLADIGYAIRQRAKAIHLNTSPQNDEFMKAFHLVDKWVRKALSHLLECQE